MNKPFHFNDNPMPKKTYKTKLSMKKIRLSHILQPNEKIYINTHNPPNKEGRTSIRAHSLAVVHEPQLNTNLFQRSNCPSSLACHTVYYIFTNRWGGENIKIISNVLQNRKANRIIYSKLIYMRDRQVLSYKMLCYVKPKGLGLITDMSVIYILAWIWSTSNQHLDRFSYLSSFDCYFPTHTHTHRHRHRRTHTHTHTQTHTRAHTHTHTHTHTPSLSLHEVLIHTSPPGAREGWGFPGQTSGACVSPPEPDAETLPSPPGTDLWSPRPQTPANTRCERLRTTPALRCQVTLICAVRFKWYAFVSSFTLKHF